MKLFGLLAAVVLAAVLFSVAWAQTPFKSYQVSVVDSQGRPVTDSVTIAVYSPGTTTPKTTYSDDAKTAIGTTLTAQTSGTFKFYCDLPALDIVAMNNATGVVTKGLAVGPSGIITIPRAVIGDTTTYGGILAGGTLQTVYSISATQNYELGTRIVLSDGRVFRYAKCGTAGWKSGYGAFFKGAIVIGETPHVAVTDPNDTVITMAEGSIAADAWAGGYIVIGHGSAATTVNRRILSNTASAANADPNHMTITLDGPVGVAETTSAYVEVIINPYADLQTTTSQEYNGVAGVPAAPATTGQFGWVQTWGPCWITPNGTPGSLAHERTVYFVGDGTINSIVTMADHTVAGGDMSTSEVGNRQLAGFIIQQDTASAGGPPFVMLQISP